MNGMICLKRWNIVQYRIRVIFTCKERLYGQTLGLMHYATVTASKFNFPSVLSYASWLDNTSEHIYVKTSESGGGYSK
jgi:hypothetical protein